MKQYIFAAAAALALGVTAPTLSAQAYSNPTGYTTETLKAGQFNLMGLTVHQPVVKAGVFERSSTNGKTFYVSGIGGGMEREQSYIVEITSGPLEGVIQEVEFGNNYSVTTPDPIGLDIPHIVDGNRLQFEEGSNSYVIRKASTIADVFGAENEAGLQATASFNTNEADIIYIPNGSGGYVKVFYSSNTNALGWYTVAGVEASQESLVYADSFFVLRNGSTDLDLVISGAVKTKPTQQVLDSNFNFVGTPYPVGVTLETSGLSNTIAGTNSFDQSEADIIYLSNGSGGFDRYFYSTNAAATGWYTLSGVASDNAEINGAMIIRRAGAATRAIDLMPPSTWSL